MRLLLWTSMPTHHQSAFLEALRERAVDLRVHYYARVDAERLSMGWDAHSVLPAGEHYVEESIRSLKQCADWRERIHIVPGCSRLFLLRLARCLCVNSVPWVHWGEHSINNSRLAVPVKRLYGHWINRHGLGALAIGELARREQIRWGIRPEKVRFLPYAVRGLEAPGTSSTETVSFPGGTRFLFLGGLREIKGVDLLLLAMSKVLAVYPNAQLELAGPDRSAGAYARDVERLGIAHAVQFSGVIPSDAVSAVLQRNDVLVVPSRHDGWGVVVNEAISLGKAVIASENCGAAHHLVRPGVNGFRVPVGDVTALANAMMSYCDRPDLAARHGAASIQIFQEFTPARNALRLERALNSLARGEANSTLAWEG